VFFTFSCFLIIAKVSPVLVSKVAVDVLGVLEAHIPLPKATEEIFQSWYDKIAALAYFPLHIGPLLPILLTGKWTL
jgi:hypothetical protein